MCIILSILSYFDLAKTIEIDALRFQNKDLNVVGTLEYAYLERQVLAELVKHAPPPPVSPPTAQEVADRLQLKDPLFTEQWHLINDEYPEHMMNTTPVWDMGFSGKGVLVSYIDDGLDNETDDLKDAFVRIFPFLFFLEKHFLT